MHNNEIKCFFSLFLSNDLWTFDGVDLCGHIMHSFRRKHNAVAAATTNSKISRWKIADAFAKHENAASCFESQTCRKPKKHTLFGVLLLA